MAKRHELPEVLVWATILDGLDDKERMARLGINVQPYDVWSFAKCQVHGIIHLRTNARTGDGPTTGKPSPVCVPTLDTGQSSAAPRRWRIARQSSADDGLIRYHQVAPTHRPRPVRQRSRSFGSVVSAGHAHTAPRRG